MLGRNVAVLYPVFALSAWTMIVLLMVGARRFRAGGRREVRKSDFRLGESENVPDHVRLPNRNYMNLLELPILFYVVSLMNFQLGNAATTVVTFGWLYVGLRVGHSLIHLSYNNVMHRFAAFAASNFVLIVIWVMTFTHVLR